MGLLRTRSETWGQWIAKWVIRIVLWGAFGVVVALVIESNGGSMPVWGWALLIGFAVNHMFMTISEKLDFILWALQDISAKLPDHDFSSIDDPP
jgi:hypothetical protein